MYANEIKFDYNWAAIFKAWLVFKLVPTHPKNMLCLRKGSSYEYIQTVVLDGQYCLNCIFYYYKRMGFLLRIENDADEHCLLFLKLKQRS